MSTTADPHSIAFDILARHKSAEADHVLMQALECDDEAVRKMAAATIVQRPGQHNILNVIRKVESLRDDACNEFSQSPERFRMALEQATRVARRQVLILEHNKDSADWALGRPERQFSLSALQLEMVMGQTLSGTALAPSAMGACCYVPGYLDLRRNMLSVVHISDA